MKHLYALCLFLSVAFWGCSNQDTAGGNSTETENAIAFLVKDAKGISLGQVAYKVLPSEFRADTLQRLSAKDYLYSGESDSMGNIFLENHQAGDFIIEIQKDSLLSAFAYDIQNSEERLESDIANEIILQKPGRVTGHVTLPKDVSHAWVFIEGTDRVVKTDSTGRFFMENVPSGENLEFQALTSGTMQHLGSLASRVRPGDTTIVNVTTIDSQTVMELKLKDYISFWMRPLQSPMVLTLRLDSSDLDFAQVKNNGRNLILTEDEISSVTPMQVTYWDSTNGRGILQVRVSTLADTSKVLKLIEVENNPSQVSTDVWEDISDSLYYALNTLTLGTFEYDTRQNALPSPVPVNFWYQSASENGTINPAKDDILAYPIEQADSGRPGRAAHFSYTGNDPEYAVIGTTLSNGTRSLAQLDSLEIWIRGDGDYSIALEDLSDSASVGIKALYKGTCTSNWSRIAIRPQDFLPADSTFGNYGWDFVKYRISTFSVFARNGHDIWIDDIRLYGVNRDDLK